MGACDDGGHAGNDSLLPAGCALPSILGPRGASNDAKNQREYRLI
jgi:hypothetical protein